VARIIFLFLIKWERKDGDLRDYDWISFGFYGTQILFFAHGFHPHLSFVLEILCCDFRSEFGRFFSRYCVDRSSFLSFASTQFLPPVFDLSCSIWACKRALGLISSVSVLFFVVADWTSSSRLFFGQQESAFGSHRRFPAQVARQGVPLPARGREFLFHLVQSVRSPSIYRVGFATWLSRSAREPGCDSCPARAEAVSSRLRARSVLDYCAEPHGLSPSTPNLFLPLAECAEPWSPALDRANLCGPFTKEPTTPAIFCSQFQVFASARCC
jgi:hypothetical protein